MLRSCRYDVPRTRGLPAAQSLLDNAVVRDGDLSRCFRRAGILLRLVGAVPSIVIVRSSRKFSRQIVSGHTLAASFENHISSI